MNLIALSINNNNQLAIDFFSLLSYRIKHNHLIIFISIFSAERTNHDTNTEFTYTLVNKFFLFFSSFSILSQVPKTIHYTLQNTPDLCQRNSSEKMRTAHLYHQNYHWL